METQLERTGLGTNPTDVWQVDSSVGWWDQKVWIPARDLLAKGIHWHNTPEEPVNPMGHLHWGQLRKHLL